MCMFKTPKAPPPPPPPTPASKEDEAIKERQRLARKVGQRIQPFAMAEGALANATPQKTLLGA